MASEMVIGESFATPAELVTLSFGPNAKQYIVHKQFACTASPVLDATFSGPSKVYRLSNKFKEETGRLLVHWIYTGKLDTQWENISEDIMFVQLWVLAGVLEIYALQDQIIREWYCTRDLVDTIPFCSTCLVYTYENTPEESPLRRFLVDLWVTGIDNSMDIVYDSDMPRRFLVEVLERYQGVPKKGSLKAEIDMAGNMDGYLV
ncbi:hypothetical protein LOCC1_G005518 [Lachnellula occidentalis]|uniref:BTB domain-containing protein n=1 Tax=Lachnellula occidentalis TaxID=215460 RepID=A0A8H8U8Q1_9HELO|nr:hypothetical protein LOCC1_G005518 [Lachnellula occidentalis]